MKTKTSGGIRLLCKRRPVSTGCQFRLTIYNGVFTPEQDNDKTTTRQMLNLCIAMKPFTPGPACLV